MAIFSTPPAENNAEPAASSAKQPFNRRKGDGIPLSIIAKDMTVTGDMSTDGVVKVEGRVKGTIRSTTQVIISPGAVIEGDVETKEAIVAGDVQGYAGLGGVQVRVILEHQVQVDVDRPRDGDGPVDGAGAGRFGPAQGGTSRVGAQGNAWGGHRRQQAAGDRGDAQQGRQSPAKIGSHRSISLHRSSVAICQMSSIQVMS